MKHFKKIRTSPRLADEVYIQVLGAITAGVIDSNKRIVQENLAEQLEVSRTPVREALIRLETEGVLARDGRTGYRTRRFTDKETLHIYQSREAIEGYAAGHLSQLGRPEVVERIRQVIRDGQNRTKSSIKDYFEVNRTIHQAFVVETDNLFLLDMFDSIWNCSRTFYLFAEMANMDFVQSIEEHLSLCDAIENNDEKEAIAAMRTHICQGLEHQLEARQITQFKLVE